MSDPMVNSERARAQDPEPDVLRTTTKASQHVLVTGAAGSIGRVVVRSLRARGHRVRGFDRVPVPSLEDMCVGDLASASDVDRAVQGVDTIVHLGATPDEADFLTELLPNNVVGAFHVFDGARRHSVKRIIGASTLQVVRGFDFFEERTVRLEDGFFPINHYSATKVFQEALGFAYAHSHGISFIGTRIGWFPRHERGMGWAHQPGSKGPQVYLSHDDAARFFIRAVEAEGIRACLVFLTSRVAETGGGLDPEPATRLGFRARDTFPDGVHWAADGSIPF